VRAWVIANGREMVLRCELMKEQWKALKPYFLIHCHTGHFMLRHLQLATTLSCGVVTWV